MAKSEPVLLLLDDNRDQIAIWKQALKRLDQSVLPLKMKVVETALEAYWAYLALGTNCVAAILDFRLDRRQRNNFDGIDLIRAFSRMPFAPQTGVRPAPWLIGVTAESDAYVHAAFNSLRDVANGHLIAMIGKDHSDTLQSDLLAAVQSRDASWVQDADRNNGHKLRVDAVIEVDRVRLEFRGRYSPEPVIVDTVELLQDISKAAFVSYAQVTITGIPESISGGSFVFRADAIRILGGSDRMPFMLKVRLYTGHTDDTGLGREARNFETYASLIKESSPLLFGHYQIESCGKRFEFIIYELISFYGNRALPYGEFWQESLDRDPAFMNSERHTKDEFDTRSREVAKSLFDALGAWHQGPRKPKTGIKKKYATEPRFEEIEQLLKHCLRKKFDANGVDCGLEGIGINTNVRLKNPLPICRQLSQSGHPVFELYCSIIHGDLHSRNILLREPRGRRERFKSTDWAVIDFEDVRPDGHVALDVAALECDLKFRRVNWSRGADFNSWLLLELELAMSLHYVKDFKVIHEALAGANPATLSPQLELLLLDLKNLRMAAKSLFPDDSQFAREINVALLFQSVRYMQWSRGPLELLRFWFAACLAATIDDDLASF